MDNSSANIDLIRSHVDIIILKPLESKDRYGYEILKEIETNSNGLFKLKQPTMYSCLKRLEKQGYINSYLGDESNGAQRRYYSLTQQGRDFLASMQSQWEFVRTILSGLVSDVDFDKDKDIQPFDPSKYRPLTKRTRSDDEQEENVKVVEKVVYVPVDNEPTELTHEEILDKLTDEDINNIIEEYKKTHVLEEVVDKKDEVTEPSETDTVNEITSPIDNDDQSSNDDIDNYIDSIDEDEIDDSYMDDSFCPTSDIFNSFKKDDEPKESNYEQLSMDDINENIYDDKTSKNDILDELTSRQSNFREDISPNDNDFDTYREDNYNKHIVKEDELIEEKPQFSSYNNYDDDLDIFDKDYDEDSASTWGEKPTAYQSFNRSNNEEKYHYNTYSDDDHLDISNDNSQVDDNLFSYSKNINEHTKSNNDEEQVNVFKALDMIYNGHKDTPIEDKHEDQDKYTKDHDDIYYNTTTPDYSKVETLGELKSKLQTEGFKVRVYNKSESSEFYINNYFYSNRASRDNSFIMFAIFFVETLLAHFILAPRFDLQFKYLALTWAVGAIVPIFFTIKWAIAPAYRKATRLVNLRLSLLLGLIVVLNVSLAIFLIGFFGFKVNYNDVNTMILPIFTPLAFLINVPLYSIMYYILYRSKRYNLN